VTRTNADIVRGGFDALERLDMDAFVADWHPEVVWDVSGYDGWPGDRTAYRGKGEILAEFANFLTRLESQHIDMHEIREVGDDCAIALYHETRRMHDVPEPIEVDVGIVYLMRDGQILRMEVYTGHDRAREAAGL
jgi:ketosteroid isomerase-like protein